MQDMQIYLARNNVQAGPYTLEQLNTMLASKEVQLDDLAWHTGLDKWQAIGELTSGQYFYDPHNQLNEKKPSEPKVIVIDATKGGMTQNHEYEQQKKRLTVDQLYGREPVNNKNDDDDAEEKEKKQIEHIIRLQLPELLGGEHILASVSTRILAVIIDQIVMLLALMPLVLRTGLEELSQMDVAQLQKLAETIPSHIMIMTSVFILATFIIQMILLTRRGQTIGKLVTGIRILDFDTQRLASVSNILVLRSILPNIAYSLPLVGLPIFLVDFVIMLTDKHKRSLHDKLAKTFVVKAKPEQLDNHKDRASN